MIATSTTIAKSWTSTTTADSNSADNYEDGVVVYIVVGGEWSVSPVRPSDDVWVCKQEILEESPDYGGERPGGKPRRRAAVRRRGRARIRGPPGVRPARAGLVIQMNSASGMIYAAGGRR